MRRLQVAAVWLLLVGAAAYLFILDPAKGFGYPSCPFRMITGLQCPGCGMLRASHQLLHGHPLAAFELNPLLALSLPFFVYFLVSFTRSGLTGRGQRRLVLATNYQWLLLGLVIAFGIFRNTPFYPFAS